MNKMFQLTDEQADAIRDKVVSQPIPWQFSMEEAFADAGYQEGLAEAGAKVTCGLCGGPMSKNPHPDAGKPATLVTVGAMFECIPCNKKALHTSSQRAAEAESKVKAREQEIYQFCVDWCMVKAEAHVFAEKYGFHMSGHGFSAFLCDLESWLGKE